jgi:hypothetical protein
MKAISLTIVLTCAPALIAAQQATAGASATASAQAGVSVPVNYSAESKAKINAAFDAARAKRVPEEPMRQRMAEGEAKGASDAQIATAVTKTEARLEAAQSAMIRAGRKNPTPDEVAAGEQAMASGATDLQLEALAKHASAEHSLVVAFSELTKLEQRGIPVTSALAQVQGNIDARGSKGQGAGVTGAVNGAVSGVVGGKRP